ncbi:hypothetical protein [Arcticibacter eurypsychrophilus]|uniref:hypothetical protein n=1 Tax=Arcticibacter eurypsychrophilus TaxID=1434752 RepID=UPI00084D3492|nr:hypothetical protein [Arcticibacter eurypsychrophilus]
MNFDDLKMSWQTQTTHTTTKTAVSKDELKSKWQKHQQAVLKMNICMSLGFLAAMIEIGWVYLTYHNEYGWPFKVSIATIYSLMIVFSLVGWRNYAFKKENFDNSSADYIAYQLKKLSWQRQLITVYIWIYTVLLWLALVMYIWEITTGATALFRYSALGIITLYVVGITVWTRLTKQKKQLILIESMTADLEDLKKKLITD